MQEGGMPRTYISFEEGAELKRLYSELEVSLARAGRILEQRGFCEEFSEADEQTARIWQRIREILQ